MLDVPSELPVFACAQKKSPWNTQGLSNVQSNPRTNYVGPLGRWFNMVSPPFRRGDNTSRHVGVSSLVNVAHEKSPRATRRLCREYGDPSYMPGAGPSIGPIGPMSGIIDGLCMCCICRSKISWAVVSASYCIKNRSGCGSICFGPGYPVTVSMA